MKSYGKLIYDRRAQDFYENKKKAQNIARKDEIKKLIEKGVSKSKLAGHQINNLEIEPFYIYFGLDGVVSDDGQPAEISEPFDIRKIDKLSEDIRNRIDESVSHGWLLTDERNEYIGSKREEISDQLEKIIGDIEAKYRAEIEIKSIEFNDTSDGLGAVFTLDVTKFLGISCEDGKIYYAEYSFKIPEFDESIDWYTEESFQYNRRNIFNLFDKFAKGIKIYKKIVDNIYTEKVADDLEYQLKSFESKYGSEFPGLEISNLEVEPVVPFSFEDIKSSLEEKYKFSFDLEAYDRQIDIYITMTFADIKDRTLEDRLLSIIKYRKRKYGLR